MLKTYKIEYTFEGNGITTIKADTVDIAKENFHDGQFTGQDNNDNYSIEKITEVKKTNIGKLVEVEVV